MEIQAHIHTQNLPKNACNERPLHISPLFKGVIHFSLKNNKVKVSFNLKRIFSSFCWYMYVAFQYNILIREDVNLNVIVCNRF